MYTLPTQKGYETHTNARRSGIRPVNHRFVKPTNSLPRGFQAAIHPCHTEAAVFATIHHNPLGTQFRRSLATFVLKDAWTQ